VAVGLYLGQYRVRSSQAAERSLSAGDFMSLPGLLYTERNSSRLFSTCTFFAFPLVTA
jgi:hypothetical protein